MPQPALLPTVFLGFNIAHHLPHLSCTLQETVFLKQEPGSQESSGESWSCCMIHLSPFMMWPLFCLWPLLKRTPCLNPWKAEVAGLLVQGQPRLSSKTLSPKTNKQANSRMATNSPRTLNMICSCPLNCFRVSKSSLLSPEFLLIFQFPVEASSKKTFLVPLPSCPNLVTRKTVTLPNVQD